MPRQPLLIAVPLAATLMSAGLASGQSTIPRAAPVKVTAKTTPGHDARLPYVFVTRGKVFPPGNSPLICPPGVTNASYCVRPTAATMCARGVVAVTVKTSGVTISNRRVRLTTSCTYRSRVRFRSRRALRVGTLTVKVRFLGTSALRARSAPKQRIVAG